MKKLNIYYVVSTIALAFMMLIMVRTLEVTGWFEKQGGNSPAQTFWTQIQGQFSYFPEGQDSIDGSRIVDISSIEKGEVGWLAVRLDTLTIFQLKVSDFEDEQVLLEIFELDSSGLFRRLDGCELLLAVDESDSWSGSTIGEFCGLTRDSQKYYSLQLRMQMDTEIQLEIETRRFDDQTLVTKSEYLLRRLDQNE